LPKVREEIKTQLKAAEAEYIKLGPEVSTTSERRQLFTSNIQLVSQTIMSSIRGIYEHQFFDNPKHMKYRALVSQAETEFRDAISKTRFSCPGELETG
jgi:hypothetical protein